ncbi:RNA-binding protein MEX3B [Adelges cooleyi]|uniref:RNA-binding protein MEX3B n=1 Tax=Adelges cooleyi TaxID=133065 RepID=UPI00217F83AA|nr:RNA-binding protein MEX3B [Adelges cooleyi]
MPTTMFADMEFSNNQHGKVIEDTRALQVALELSMLYMSGEQRQKTELPMSGGNAGMVDSSMVSQNYNIPNGFPEEPRNKKSQNMTECVPVPSSEHVAEIVGRQGCKIKALRAKTNTYIKTPVRGEEPVFVVTGRKEDVAKAKKEILSAAEHFSQIRASRKNMAGTLSPPGPPTVPGHVTIQVRVPYRVVGLVVGPKGATIKRIQHQTGTYIVTPSRDKEPVFDVTGLPDSVETAKREIEAHIALRTGNGLMDDENGVALAALCKANPLAGLFDLTDSMGPAILSGSSGCSSGSVSSCGSGISAIGDLGNIWSDEGIGGESPSFENVGLWGFMGSSRPSPASSTSPPPAKKTCMVCHMRDIDAALVPCGHNLFCLDCASNACDSNGLSSCPVCKMPARQAIRIIS